METTNQTTLLVIENPSKEIAFTITWEVVKDHLKKVIASFPNEFKLIKDESNEMMFLKMPITPDAKAIASDQIIYARKISSTESTSIIHLEITNENGKINSYREKDRDQTSLDQTAVVLQKSIAGTLNKTLSNINQKAIQTQQVKGGMGIIKLLAALIAIAFGIYALTR